MSDICTPSPIRREFYYDDIDMVESSPDLGSCPSTQNNSPMDPREISFISVTCNNEESEESEDEDKVMESKLREQVNTIKEENLDEIESAPCELPESLTSDHFTEVNHIHEAQETFMQTMTKSTGNKVWILMILITISVVIYLVSKEFHTLVRFEISKRYEAQESIEKYMLETQTKNAKIENEKQEQILRLKNEALKMKIEMDKEKDNEARYKNLEAKRDAKHQDYLKCEKSNYWFPIHNCDSLREAFLRDDEKWAMMDAYVYQQISQVPFVLDSHTCQQDEDIFNQL